MVVCCKCNRSSSCKGCACVKAGQKCQNCLPSRLGHCQNNRPVTSTVATVATDISAPSSIQLSNSTSSPPPSQPISAEHPSTCPPITEEQDQPDQSQCPSSASSSELRETTHVLSPNIGLGLPDYRAMSEPVFSWGQQSSESFTHSLHATYSEVVHWRPNILRVTQVHMLVVLLSQNLPGYSMHLLLHQP